MDKLIASLVLSVSLFAVGCGGLDPLSDVCNPPPPDMAGAPAGCGGEGQPCCPSDGCERFLICETALSGERICVPHALPCPPPDAGR